MSGIQKPFRRTFRQFADGKYTEGGRWQLVQHPKYAVYPDHYVRGFMVLQQDLFRLFQHVEPADQNEKTYSFRTLELLIRACIEVEANFTAILRENGYTGPKGSKNWTMCDYRKVEISHRLSGYTVRCPDWAGVNSRRQPFAQWEKRPIDGGPSWYQIYNRAKHDRPTHFPEATFGCLIDAIAGLVVLLTAQFLDEDFSRADKTRSVGCGYDTDDGMEGAVGGYFRVAYPSDWPPQERYDFDWAPAMKADDPFVAFDYTRLP